MTTVGGTAPEFKDIIIICDCSHLDHAMRFTYNTEDRVWYVDMVLHRRTFWRRVRTAWRHVFGNTCGFGEMSEVVLRKEHVERLKEWLTVTGV